MTSSFSMVVTTGLSSYLVASRRAEPQTLVGSETSLMEPPTMLLVPICRDMQLW